MNRLGLHPAPDLLRPGPPHHPSDCPSAGPRIMLTVPPFSALELLPLFPARQSRRPVPPACPSTQAPWEQSRMPDPQCRSSALPCPATTFLPGPLGIFFSGSDRSCVFSPMPHTSSGLEWGHQVSGTHRPACPRRGHCLRGAGLLVTWDSLGLGLRALLPASLSATPSLACSLQSWTQPPPLFPHCTPRK